MLRHRVGVIVAVACVAALICSAIVFRRSPKTPQIAEQLEVFAAQFAAQRPDMPHALNKLQEVTQTAKSGRFSDLDGVLLLAEIIPAWWLARDDIHEISIIMIAREPSIKEVSIVRTSGVGHVLPNSKSQLQLLDSSSGFAVYLLKIYVNTSWSPEAGAAVEDLRSDQQFYTRGDYHNFYDQLERDFTPTKIKIRDHEIPLSVGRRPQPVTGG